MLTLHSHPLFSLRLSSLELVALAVSELFPNALRIGGQVTDIGFFYDFIFEQPLHDQALTLIEVHLKKLIKDNLEIRSLSMMRENADVFFAHQQQPVLAEKASLAEINIVSLIQIGNFHDLCPEVQQTVTGQLGAIKLLETVKCERLILDEKVVVTRIIGTAFDEPQSLKKFIKAYNHFDKQDHRLLGAQLDLFSFSEHVSQIECFWHPKGEVLKEFFLKRWRSYCLSRNAHFVRTPLVVKENFSKQREGLAKFEVEEEQYLLSSSRLNHYIQLFKRKNVADSELPLRFAEFAQVYEGQEDYLIWGLLRSYSYGSDQLISFCKEEQLIDELISSLHFIEEIVRIFGFKGQWYLVVSELKKSKKKSDERAIKWLSQGIKANGLSVEREEKTSLNFQPPRLEMRFVDKLSRTWTGAEIELNVQLAERLNVHYEDENQHLQTPLILKTSVFGSLDRMIALLIEQYEGILPFWLAPEQVRILAIGQQNQAYVQAVYQECYQRGFRVSCDIRSDKLGTRIHEAEKEKIPYLILIGDKEREKQLITVRTLLQRNVPEATSLESFLEKLQQQVVPPSKG